MADYSQYRFIVGSENYPLRFNSLIDRLQQVDNEVVDLKEATVTTGNGLTGGGDKGVSRSLAVGTGGQLDFNTTNSTTADSHTHSVTKATQAQAEVGTANNVGMSVLRVVQHLLSRIATNAQIDSGSGDQLVSPAGSARYYTNSIASQAVAQAGVNSTALMTPLRVKQNMDVKKASNADANTFTGDDTWVSPLQTKNSLDVNIEGEVNRLSAWQLRGVGRFVRAQGLVESNPVCGDAATGVNGDSYLVGMDVIGGTRVVFAWVLYGSGSNPVPVNTTITFDPEYSMVTTDVTGVDYHPVLDKVIIVGGAFSTATIMTGSFTDGGHWEEVVGPGTYYRCVKWVPQVSRAIFLADGRIMSSTDLDSFNNTALTGTWERVVGAPDKNIIVAVASSGAQSVATSVNGTTWTLRNTPATGWTGLAYSPLLGLFVATKATSGANKMVSTDGINWVLINDGQTAGRRVEWCDSLGMFVTLTSSNGVLASVSTDGYNWQPIRYEIPNVASFSGVKNGVTWNNELGVMMTGVDSGTLSHGRMAYSTLG